MKIRLRSYPWSDNALTSMETLKVGLQDLVECCKIEDKKISEAVSKLKNNKIKRKFNQAKDKKKLFDITCRIYIL